VRIALSAARNPVVTSWLVFTRNALPLVPAIARASRFDWAPTCSAGEKTPMTNVAIDGVLRAAVVARAAIDGMAVGAHSVGNSLRRNGEIPSVQIDRGSVGLGRMACRHVGFDTY